MDERWSAWRATNLANWESRVPIHVGPRGYAIDRLLADPSYLSRVVAFDAPFLGPLAGLDVAHLQCHIGTDTLSLARLGARVTGLDFSPSALAEARLLFDRAGAMATFVEADVFDAVTALGTTFDLVYTSIGTIGWLPDINAWARVVVGLLRPGGRLYLRDAHPLLMSFALDLDGPPLRLHFDWFETVEPVVLDEPGTYVGDGAAVASTTTNEWSRGLGEIVSALITAGLTVTALREHEFVDWQAFPWMVETGPDEDHWVFPSGTTPRVPLEFTVEALLPG